MRMVSGGNFAVLRNKFLKVNGFDTNYIGNVMLEDVDFDFQSTKLEVK